MPGLYVYVSTVPFQKVLHQNGCHMCRTLPVLLQRGLATLPLCHQEMGSDSSRLESGEDLVLGHLLATNSIQREEVLRGF